MKFYCSKIRNTENSRFFHLARVVLKFFELYFGAASKTVRKLLKDEISDFTNKVVEFRSQLFSATTYSFRRK